MFVRVLHRPASRLRACPPGLLIRSRSPQDLLLVGLTAGRGFSFVSWRTQPSVPFQTPGRAAAFDLISSPAAAYTNGTDRSTHGPRRHRAGTSVRVCLHDAAVSFANLFWSCTCCPWRCKDKTKFLYYTFVTSRRF
jgi:hypothetical protein